MLLKLNILNIDKFLDIVNACTGPVTLAGPEGGTAVLAHNFALQEELRSRFFAAGQWLPLTLRVRTPRDYFHIVSYYTGDC